MTKKLLLTLLAMTVMTGIKAQSYQAQKDTVYAANVCIEDLANNYVSNTDRPEYDKKGNLKKKLVTSVSDWNTQWNYTLSWPSASRTLAYYVHVPEGHTRADMLIATRSGKTATIHVKFSNPETKEVIYSGDIHCNKPGEQQLVECLPDINIEKDAWYRLEFTSEDASSCLGRFDYILFQRTSTTAICTPRIYSAIATYLSNWRTTNTEAPTGASFDCVYLEVKAPEDYEGINSYISTMNLLGGYLGIQSCLDTSVTPRNYFKNFWHNVIFSMWDNGDVDKTPYLPEYLRSGGLDKNEAVKFNRFGNEGTGIQAMKGEGYWWQPGKWVQMLFTCRPEDITVTIDDNGTPKTFVYNNTLVSLWYKMEGDSEWTYQATLRKSGTGNYVDTWGAFLENWSPTAGQYRRDAVFRNCYLHSIASNKWYHCNRASSGVYYDASRLRADLRDRRIDMNWGISEEDPNAIYMTAGGFGNMHDCVMRTYTVPQAEDQQCVDTINLLNMQRRVDQAVRNYYRNTVMTSRYEENPTQEGLKALAEDLIAQADQFNGYTSEALEPVIRAYNNGSFNQTMLRRAIYTMAEDHSPLLYSSVQRLENIGTYRAYMLRQPAGQGIVSGKLNDDGTASLRAACSTANRATEEAKEQIPVTDLNANWVLIRPDKGDDYYLYNIGLEKFLDLSKDNLLSSYASPLAVSKVPNGFAFKQADSYLCIQPTSTKATVSKARAQNASATFELLDNVTMQPSDEYINKVIDRIGESADYVELAEEVASALELPDGVVGAIVDENIRQQLEEAITLENMSPQELRELFNSAERIAFEPETTLYRLRSASRSFLSKPYVTVDDAQTLSVGAIDETRCGQYWQFEPEGEGYKLSSQGLSIVKIATTANQQVVVGDTPGTIYLVDLGGCHFTIRGSKTTVNALLAGTSALTTGVATSPNAVWFLEPAKTINVDFSDSFVKPFHAAFDAKPAEGTAAVAYYATGIAGQPTDGQAQLTTATLPTDLIPAGTPVLLDSKGSKTVALQVYPKTTEQQAKAAAATPTDNIFRGTFLKTSVARNVAFLLDSEAEQPVMKLNVMTSLPANTVYIPAEEMPEGTKELTFDTTFTGIEAIKANKNDVPQYDMQGRRLTETPAKGVYIYKGKKVIK